ncbi:MAG: DbpA RNA binding domain-containing protein, partial [Gammaproteobacteria bacterium]|nr:DbpA RNA binding domain-containing protein [Gammaproteobacteria bacterium]
GAIANEEGLDSEHIGHIDIQENYPLIDLPSGMPNDVFQDLRRVWVCGQKLEISRLEKERSKAAAKPAAKGGKRHKSE